MAKIISLIRRPGPIFTEVDLNGRVYRFRPEDRNDPESLHTCEVTLQEHINRFLSITEGYALAPEPEPGDDFVIERPAFPPVAQEVAAVGTQLDAQALTPALAEALPAAALAAVVQTEPAAPAEADAAQEGDGEGAGDDQAEAEAEPEGTVFDSMATPALRDAYEKVFGKPPQVRMGRDKLIAALAALPTAALPADLIKKD